MEYSPKNYSFEDLRGMMADLILSQKETDKKFQNTDKKFQETEKLLSEKFQDTDKKVKELANLFTTDFRFS